MSTSAGAAIAQDWRNLDAETAPSNFDQRHQINAQFQYTTGMGVGGGALLDGVKGKLFKGWTVTGNLITGSGLPITPIILSARCPARAVYRLAASDPDRRVDGCAFGFLPESGGVHPAAGGTVRAMPAAIQSKDRCSSRSTPA